METGFHIPYLFSGAKVERDGRKENDDTRSEFWVTEHQHFCQ